MKYREFAGFVLAGGAATVLNYSIFLILLLLSVQYLVASATGYVSGIFLSYLINKHFVFKQSKKSLGRGPRYVLVYSGALFFQLALLTIFVRFGVLVEVANAFALVVTVVLNFFVTRRFVFGGVPED